MNITTVSAPPFEPIGLEYLYDALRLDTEGSPPTHFDDTRLAALISAGREVVEKMTRRSLVRRTLRASFSMFPVSDSTYAAATAAQRMVYLRKIPLYYGPVQSVESVQYYDTSNALQTVDSADYYLTDEPVPQLRFLTTFSAPTVYDRPDAVRVTYVAGYEVQGSPGNTAEDYRANIPAALQEAVAMHVQGQYDEMLPQDKDSLDKALEALVQPFRLQIVL